jgi:hypothetical protein
MLRMIPGLLATLALAVATVTSFAVTPAASEQASRATTATAASQVMTAAPARPSGWARP